jgi:carbon-monoxide dehydrogenase large subunit
MGEDGLGKSALRREDRRLLTGSGLFVDDIRLPEMLHGAVLRSPHAHARVVNIDVSAAVLLPGVHLVLTHSELGHLGEPLPLLLPHPNLTHARTQRALAKEKVRYVGEPVAFTVAESRARAEDAVDRIVVEYEPLDPIAKLGSAVGTDVPSVHDDVPNNIAGEVSLAVGDAASIFGRAAIVIEETFTINRGTGLSIEARGVLSEYDRHTGELTVWDSTQAPIPLRNHLARLFQLPAYRVRVIAPDIGGGFGSKAMLCYPEEILVPLAAIRLGRPVKWVEDRRENLLATNQEREQTHRVALALTSDGRILGIRDSFLYDTGAYIPYGFNVPNVAALTIPGPYRVPNYECQYTAVYTNKPTVSPYRGSGRPHAVFVMERLLDRAARSLGMDPLDLRLRNLIAANEFPYDTGLIYQDGAPMRYDSGDYERCLRAAAQAIDYETFSRRQQLARESGRYLGLGIACYVEGTGYRSLEGVSVEVDPLGKVIVSTGGSAQGQGHETMLAQVIAPMLTIRTDDLVIVSGDTARFGYGSGTWASRAAVLVTNAAVDATKQVRTKIVRVAASLLEARPEDLALDGGYVIVRGSPARRVSFADVAAAAIPGRGALSDGETPGLAATSFFTPAQAAYANGVHAVLIEVDRETADLSILRYAVVHDCGRIINPIMVEGQIHGGVAQGIGGALYEQLVFDEGGQPLHATLMDYLVPSAVEVPNIEVIHVESPSPLNPLGIKGAGEAGVIPVNAALAQAVDSAFADLGIYLTEMPLSPSRLWAIVRQAKSARLGPSLSGRLASDATC